MPPRPRKPTDCASYPTTLTLSTGEVGDLASCSDWHGELKVWLVERASEAGWDECRALVVIAATEADARLLFPDEPRVRAKALVTCVGLALPGAQAGTVICRDDLEA